MMVKNVMSTLEKAKVEPVYVAAEVKRLYTDLGYEVKAPLITDKEDMPKLYDCTEIATELGIYSSSGKPHNQAVGAIIKKLHISNTEIVCDVLPRRPGSLRAQAPPGRADRRTSAGRNAA